MTCNMLCVTPLDVLIHQRMGGRHLAEACGRASVLGRHDAPGPMAKRVL